MSFLERTARHLKFVLKKHSATVRIAPFKPNTKEGGGETTSSLATPSMVMSASAQTVMRAKTARRRQTNANRILVCKAIAPTLLLPTRAHVLMDIQEIHVML